MPQFIHVVSGALCAGAGANCVVQAIRTSQDTHWAGVSLLAFLGGATLAVALAEILRSIEPDAK